MNTKMKMDFKILNDRFGYYVVGYRMMGTTEIQYTTNKTIADVFNLRSDDIKEYFHAEFNADEKSKNDRQHFQNYDDAVKCMESMRDLVPKAIQTGNFFLAV